MEEYDPKNIEPKWQKYWQETNIFKAVESTPKPRFYSLMEFPYPSGEGLHTGHVRGFTAMDIVSRKRRMEGFEVMYPIGWDAFGLPTENYAIKTGRQPSDITAENIATYKKQFTDLGMSFDWSREVNTTDPAYFKWTQWLFLKFLEHDLAYKAKMNINWCPKDKIGLANEEVVDGKCERCGTEVEKREKEQWMLRITKYADRLDKDLETVDFPERVKLQQQNWIGKSIGAEIDFKVDDRAIKVFTTRPDTIFGATFIAVAPELAKKWIEVGRKAEPDVTDYIENVIQERKVRDFEEKEKTGIYAGFEAINPANNQKIPVWIVNYVLGDVGTGAIMGVPAHDERDFEFAKKFKLPIIEDAESASPKVIEDLGGKMVTKFKLRDWVFSRQRYWGEPIPVIHCDKCGVVPVPEKDLPVLLPDVEKYEPTENGESPLANIPSFVDTECPQCGGKAKRETDTMPNWAGSSWYFLRYTDPQNAEAFASKEKLNDWMAVDWYNGGMEHTTLHLLYSRFWNKFLFDIGLVPTSEPYKKRTSHGFILAENGDKMSKSKGNVINPDKIIKQFGADTLRLYEMFMGPFEQAISWNENSLVGPRRFIERVWKLKEKATLETDPEIDDDILMYQTIDKVTKDIELLNFNTAVSSLMIYTNSLEKRSSITLIEYKNLLLLLSPFAPHVCEELWNLLGNKESIQKAVWPEVNVERLEKREVVIALQINGKTRANISVSKDVSKEELEALALAHVDIKKWLKGAVPKRIIVVLGKIVNLVL
ncbi:leucine--tRNA ligase [soil metagenome]